MHCSFCGAPLQALTTSCSSCGAQPVLGERYEIREFIGRGGMGEVFLAHDRRLDTEVAIKRLPPQFASSPELRESLHKEARILARLSDSAITRLFDLEEFHGGSYLILEYVCGPSLRALIEAGYPFTPHDMMHVMAQVSQGLTTAHREGIIHRDLKPSNLLLALEGPDREAYRRTRQLPQTLAKARVKIADFGIAKAVADARLTMTNAFSGTPGYMAPEQFRNEVPSPETDVYAMGIVTREMAEHVAVHPAVHQVIQKATAQERAYRYRTPAEFTNALYHALEGRYEQPSVAHALKPAARPIIGLLLVVFGVVACVVAVLVIVQQKSTSRASNTKLTPMPVFDKPVEIDWHSPPRIAEPPPSAGDSRPLAAAAVEGPRKGAVRWSITLPVVGSVRIRAIASDGTVYATGFPSGLCAIRDGKLLWAYKTGPTGAIDLQLDAEGRLWYRTFDGVFCLNQKGDGGRLPAGTTMRNASRTRTGFRCLPGGILSGPSMRIELDGECNADTAIEHRGVVFVATDLPLLEALGVDGRKRWSFRPPCTPTKLLPAADDQVVFPCKGGSLHSVSSGRENWTRASDGEFSNPMISDAKGTVYFGDYSRVTGGSHLHAVGSDGRERWSIEMSRASPSDMVLGGDGQLYVSASSPSSKVMAVE